MKELINLACNSSSPPKQRYTVLVGSAAGRLIVALTASRTVEAGNLRVSGLELQSALVLTQTV